MKSPSFGSIRDHEKEGEGLAFFLGAFGEFKRKKRERLLEFWERRRKFSKVWFLFAVLVKKRGECWHSFLVERRLPIF